MRLIGYLENEPGAHRLGDYLYAQGIHSRIELEREGLWAIWVFEEDALERARQILDEFRQNPAARQFLEAAQRGRDLRARHQAQDEAAADRHFEAHQIFRRSRWGGAGPVTLGLIGISLLFALGALWREDFYDYWFLYLPAVQQGQVWRLITPIFIHSGVLHLAFNMLWLYDLGGILEARQGSVFLGLQVLVVGTLSNLAQALIVGPAFGGMSGVVYGLLGYIWIRGKFDPRSGLFLHPQTVALMIIWFFLGFTGFMHMANVVHGVGLGLGMLWGYAAAQSR